MAGRKPKPTALKKLEGNPGKRKLNTKEPVPGKGMPGCPKWLLPEAKKEWERLCVKLSEIGVLTEIGIEKGMILEVHSSLSRFGELEGGAETIINTLKEIVTEEGSIFMPALRLSKELPLSEEDKELGITVKIKILPPGSDRTAMGIVADTFRKHPDTYTGQDIISTRKSMV